jgi:hypothetical protein
MINGYRPKAPAAAIGLIERLAGKVTGEARRTDNQPTRKPYFKGLQPDLPPRPPEEPI